LDELSRLFYLSIDLADRSDEMRVEHHLLARAICDRDPERAAKTAGELARRAHPRALEALTPPLDGNRLGSVEVNV
jgi:DNA-binding GntR family transcriptional regulator